MSRPLSYYQDLITSQHRDKPKFMAWLTAALEILGDVQACADAMYAAFDLDLAVSLVSSSLAGPLASIEIATGGEGYQVDDELTVIQEGASGGTFVATSVDAVTGEIGGADAVMEPAPQSPASPFMSYPIFGPISPGYGYRTSNGLPTSGGHGMGCTVNITTAPFMGAGGVQLDILGQIVGVSRRLPFQPTGGASPILDDATYRTLLKARIALNQWDGTVPGIQASWKFIFPDRSIIIQDNQDMTMAAICIGIFSPIEQDLISHGYIVPKPQGVGINYAFGPVFAYDEDTNTMKGYDEGTWV